MIKICQNVLCGVEFEPTPQLQRRQKYCHRCAQLPTKARRRQEPIKTKICQNPACGKVFTPRPNLADRQRHCSANCQRDHVRNDSIVKGSRNIKRVLPRVECICPKCRRYHTMSLVWIGDGMPWKYCEICSEYRRGPELSGTIVDHVFQASF